MPVSIPNSIRNVSFTHHSMKIAHPNSSCIGQGCIVLEDIDSDGCIECCIGSTEGVLSIYRFKELIGRCEGLGMITCVCYGRKLLSALTAQGRMYLFYFNHRKGSVISKVLKPTIIHPIPANVYTGMYFDIDEDGRDELILLCNDRRIYVYKINDDKSIKTQHSWFMDRHMHSVTQHNGRLVIGFVTGEYGVVFKGKPGTGHVSMGTVYEKDGYYIHIRSLLEDKDIQIPLSVEGNFMKSENDTPTVILSIVGGKVRTRNLESGEDTWAIDVRTEILEATSIDICGKERQICIVTWDGLTYIVDQNHNAVCFNLKQRIRAYSIGRYSIHPNLPISLCILYVTFDNQIVICSNLKLDAIPLQKFDPGKDPDIQNLASDLNIDLNPNTWNKLIYHSGLYFDKIVQDLIAKRALFEKNKQIRTTIQQTPSEYASSPKNTPCTPPSSPIQIIRRSDYNDDKNKLNIPFHVPDEGDENIAKSTFKKSTYPQESKDQVSCSIAARIDSSL